MGRITQELFRDYYEHTICLQFYRSSFNILSRNSVSDRRASATDLNTIMQQTINSCYTEWLLDLTEKVYRSILTCKVKLYTEHKFVILATLL